MCVVLAVGVELRVTVGVREAVVVVVDVLDAVDVPVTVLDVVIVGVVVPVKVDVSEPDGETDSVGVVLDETVDDSVIERVHDSVGVRVSFAVFVFDALSVGVGINTKYSYVTYVAVGARRNL